MKIEPREVFTSLFPGLTGVSGTNLYVDWLESRYTEMLEALIAFVRTHSHGEYTPKTHCDCMGCRGREVIEKAIGKKWKELSDE